MNKPKKNYLITMDVPITNLGACMTKCIGQSDILMSPLHLCFRKTAFCIYADLRIRIKVFLQYISCKCNF